MGTLFSKNHDKSTSSNKKPPKRGQVQPQIADSNPSVAKSSIMIYPDDPNLARFRFELLRKATKSHKPWNPGTKTFGITTELIAFVHRDDLSEDDLAEIEAVRKRNEYVRTVVVNFNMLNAKVREEMNLHRTGTLPCFVFIQNCCK